MKPAIPCSASGKRMVRMLFTAERMAERATPERIKRTGFSPPFQANTKMRNVVARAPQNAPSGIRDEAAGKKRYMM